MPQTTPVRPGSEPGDSAYHKIRLDLALAARRWRRRSELSRRRVAAAAADVLPASTSRAEDDPPATIDVLVRSLLALGATRRDIALEIVRDT